MLTYPAEPGVLAAMTLESRREPAAERTAATIAIRHNIQRVALDEDQISKE
jgi:hypothetical protein